MCLLAGEESTRADQLQDELARKTKQLKTAVKQRNLHWQAILDARESTEAQLRGQVKILLDQSRRTDDALRRKAGRFDAVDAARENLAKQYHLAMARVEELDARNETLELENEALRAREAAGREVESDSYEAESAAETGDESHSDSGSSRARRKPKPTGKGKGKGGNPAGQAGRKSSGLIETDAEATGFACEWRQGEVACGLIADSRACLQEHLRGHMVGIKPLP